ncbi:MAG: metallophosphoesterase [Patescibacteria group bacterium]|nr:metallophosphoesterase [Patescibacteria group bacterium]
MTKICCIADLHGSLPVIEPCDILLIAGDICPEQNQREWMLHIFEPWAKALQCTIIAVAGNHDRILQVLPFVGWLKALPITFLDNTEIISVNGIHIYGTPWHKRFGNGVFMAEEEDLQEIYSQIPKNIDILLTHGPPYVVLDHVSGFGPQGGKALRAAISLKKPKYVVCGHLHNNYGTARVGDTTVINCALSGLPTKRLKYKPFYFEI